MGCEQQGKMIKGKRQKTKKKKKPKNTLRSQNRVRLLESARHF
jgi:hypothetical protein